MYRKFSETLAEWEKKQDQKPLMVIGARQTGKTWIIRDFCEKTYPEYIYINLEENQDMQSVFQGNLDPDSVIRNMQQLLGRKIMPETPIFLDEIQVSERAITALKYFCEDSRNFRIICAGSLLGVKLNRFETSFPVGKVRIVNLYPMDFEEFLLACGEEYLRDGIRDSFVIRKPLAEGVHEKALRLYHDYLFTGGMPESILDYLQNEKDVFSLDSSIQKNLQMAYLADMTKYVTSPQESVKITETYRSIPRQLAKDNPKFKYSEVRHGANKRDFSGPLDWLEAAGMIYRIPKLSLPASPLKGYEEENSFKVYLSDVGMLTALCGMKVRDLLPETHNIYKGGVIENYVIQQMKVNHDELYYYKPSDSMEIDVVFDDGNAIVPLEIKSGRHKRSTSLKNYREKFRPEYAVRISERAFGWNDGLFLVPLYAVFCI